MGALLEPKVFAIGMNKTGTSSIQALYKQLGLNGYHGVEWRRTSDTSFHRRYDAFSDGMPDDFAELDAAFPRSRFILNVRCLDQWLDSRIEHHGHLKETGRPPGGEKVSEELVKKWVHKRHQHHLRVMAYFEHRLNDLLIVNFIDDEKAATKIANHIGFQGDYERPHVKPIASRREAGQLKNRDMIYSALAEIGVQPGERSNDLYCFSMLQAHEPQGFPVDTLYFRW
jgi:hypothetical protein